jgi:hypothetical protein
LGGRSAQAALAAILGLGVVTAPAAATMAASDPVGSFDLASAQPGLVRVAGWSLDADAATTALQMHVYVGGPAGTSGAEGHAFTASLSRPDVAADFPAAGPNHGLDVTFETAKRGSQSVCLYAINVGSGSNVLLGCKPVSIADPNPVGNFDLASGQPGLVRVAGWSLDPNAPTAPLAMHAYVGGQAGAAGAEGHAFTASVSRPDVAAAYPGAGDAHGLDVTFETALRGTQPVCLYAINISAGGNQLLGCKTVAIADPNPLGSLDVASAQPGTVRVAGWSFDPNTPTEPTSMQAVIGGGETHTFTAAASRPDVAAAYPGAGDRHGVDATFETGQRGVQSICLYALNVGPGSNTLVGCRTVTIADPDPIGGFDGVRSPDIGVVEVRAWAFDPTAPTSPPWFRFFVGVPPDDPAAELHTFKASASRTDVSSLYPSAGSAHGLDETFSTAARGGEAICVYVDNTGPGRDRQLGCKSVTIDGSDDPQVGVSSGSTLVVGGSARLRFKYAYGWQLRGGVTRLRRMRITFTGDASGATVAVTCRGASRSGCPFRRRTFAPKRGVVSLNRALSRPLKPRTVILLTVVRAGKQVGNGIQLVTRSDAGPVLTRVKPRSNG